MSTANDHNRYACNNFDVLFKGIETSDKGNAAEQLNDQTLAGNLQKWLAALVEKAHNPNNLLAQGLIPGLNSQNARTPNWQVDEATYLATCSNNFTPASGTGFNDVNYRGTYAINYTGEVTDLSSVLILANSSWRVFGIKNRRWPIRPR